MNNIIELKSKGQVRRLAIQNPELFDEVVRAMGYMKRARVLSVDEIKDIVDACEYPSRFRTYFIVDRKKAAQAIHKAIYGEAQTKGDE